MKYTIDTQYLSYDIYRKNKQKRARIKKIIADALLVGAIAGIVSMILFSYITTTLTRKYGVEVAQAQEITKQQTIEAIELMEPRKEWTQETIIDEIEKVFPNEKIMVRVALCEGTKHGKLDPDVVNPTNGSNDTGIFQISEKYHGKAYRALGYDDMTDPEQNIAYAHHLYETQGLAPWSASKGCWGK